MSGLSSSALASTPSRPDPPWLPATVHVYGVYKRTRTVWVRSARTGTRERRPKTSYDVRWHVDGREFRHGTEQKGWADDYANRLKKDFAAGWLFDPGARRFVATDLTDDQPADPLTFFEHAADYFARQWHRWQPSTRRDSQRVLAAACISLVRAEAPPLTPEDCRSADAYLRRVHLAVPPGVELSDEEEAWAGWFQKWSTPLRAVDDRQLKAFVDRTRLRRLDGQKRTSPMVPAAIARSRAIVRAAFTNARKRYLIDRDPWDAVEREPLRDHDQVDPDLVMDPGQVREMAEACGSISPRYRAYVLIQGRCGLRPGEAAELRRRDFNLDPAQPTVTVGGTYITVNERFFAEGETRRGPLKGRGRKATRTVPVPAEMVPELRRHLDEHVGKGRDAVVFTNTSGGRINSSNFIRDVWSKARQQVFEDDSPLRRVRRHDLRHSAITVWLNAGVPLKTAQRWSGHKTLSVLLDTYTGVMRNDDAVAVERFEAALTKVVTGS